MNEHKVNGETKVQSSDINFFVIGGQRCGSTWLYAALKEHPDIYVPEEKQTYFFDSEYKNGMQWYLSHFENAEPATQTIGEVATGYCMTHAIPRLAEHCPQAKLIMIVRNPVDRGYSYYKNRKPVMGWQTFEEALIQDDNIKSRGRYIEQVETVQAHFPPEQFLLLFYDDLEKNEEDLFKRVCTFLEIDKTFSPSVIGNPVHANFLPGLRAFVYKHKLTHITDPINRSIVGNLIRRLARRQPQKQRTATMASQTREELAAYFKPYNERLGQFSKRNLQHWK